MQAIQANAWGSFIMLCCIVLLPNLSVWYANEAAVYNQLRA